MFLTVQPEPDPQQRSPDALDESGVAGKLDRGTRTTMQTAHGVERTVSRMNAWQG